MKKDFQTTVTNEKISQIEKETIALKAQSDLLKGLLKSLKAD